jgi:hypothetical protein
MPTLNSEQMLGWVADVCYSEVVEIGIILLLKMVYISDDFKRLSLYVYASDESTSRKISH